MKNKLLLPITAILLSITTCNASATLKNILSLGYVQSQLKMDSNNVTDTPKGINVKYNYKLMNDWGLFSSFTYNKEKYSFAINDSKGNINYNYYLFSIDPSYHFNECINLYGLIGISSINMKLNSENNSSNIHFNKISNSYSSGLQYNPIAKLAIDASYEYSKLNNIEFGTWVVGLGYRF
ncbi:MAG: Ail/Lom family outer membrane beta-barrel protein [Proteus vulgaris]